MKAFAYMRVSGRGQESGDGFERQRLAIEKYAATNGIEIIDWFRDVQTGKDEWQERTGWSAMMSAMNGTRTILVEKLDRVARVVLIQELICKDLKDKDIQLLSSSGEDTDDEQPERVMFRQMLSVFASYERTCIVLKLRGARQRKKAETGKCEGQKVYGGKPGESAIIAEMQRMRENGSTLKQITSALQLTPTRKGGPWTIGAVHKILTRETRCQPKQ